MLGKVAPYLFVGIAEMILILTAMRFGFGVPIRGSLVFLFGMAIVYLFALLSSRSFSTLVIMQAQAMQLAQFFMLPSFMLSGYIFPMAGLPPGCSTSSGILFPATHMTGIMRGVSSCAKPAPPRCSCTCSPSSR